MPTNEGTPITRDTIFDKASLDIWEPSQLSTSYLYLYAGDARIGYINAHSDYGTLNAVFNETDPEVIEVQRRLDSGECALHFERAQFRAPYTTFHWSELQDTLWYLPTVYPFHERGVDPHHFFDALGRGTDYHAPTTQMPARLIVPGIMEGASRRYYKRDDSAATPDVSSVDALADAGWFNDIPYGSHALFAVDVLDAPQGVAISNRQRIYHRRKDVDGAIRAIARKWHEYWSGLTTSEQAINVRMTAEKHVTHAIGRAWAEKPFSGDIRIFEEGDRFATARDARDAEDWMLGNLEQWAHEWGFAALSEALAGPDNRVNLNVQLDDYTFCLIKRDGSVGDRLANPNEGILEATWDAWGSTDYNAALGTIIRVETAADYTVHVAGFTARLTSTVNVVNPSGATTYAWEQVEGDAVAVANPASATASFTAPALNAGDDPKVFTFKVTATNNGESASDTITVTVNAPAEEE